MSNPNTNNASIIQQFLEENVTQPTVYKTLDPSQFSKPDIQSKTKDMMDTIKEGQSVTNRFAYIDPTSATGYNQNVANVNAANKAMYENTIQKIANQVASNITAAEKTRQLTKGTPYEDEPFTGRFFVSRIGKDKAGQLSDPVTIDESIDSKWRDTSRPMTPAEKEQHFQDWYRSQDSTRFANEAEARAQYSNEGQDQTVSTGKELAGGSWERTQVQEGVMSGGAYDTRPFMVRSVAPVTIESQTPYAAAPEWKPKVMTDEIKVSKREKATGGSGPRPEVPELSLYTIGSGGDTDGKNQDIKDFNAPSQNQLSGNLTNHYKFAQQNMRILMEGRDLANTQVNVKPEVTKELGEWLDKKPPVINNAEDALHAEFLHKLTKKVDTTRPDNAYTKLWASLPTLGPGKLRTTMNPLVWMETTNTRNMTLPKLSYVSSNGQTENLQTEDIGKLYDTWAAQAKLQTTNPKLKAEAFTKALMSGEIRHKDSNGNEYTVYGQPNAAVNKLLSEVVTDYFDNHQDELGIVKSGKYKNLNAGNRKVATTFMLQTIMLNKILNQQ